MELTTLIKYTTTTTYVTYLWNLPYYVFVELTTLRICGTTYNNLYVPKITFVVFTHGFDVFSEDTFAYLPGISACISNSGISFDYLHFETQ